MNLRLLSGPDGEWEDTLPVWIECSASPRHGMTPAFHPCGYCALGAWVAIDGLVQLLNFMACRRPVIFREAKMADPVWFDDEGAEEK